MTEDCGVIHKMRTATLAEECGKNPKVVSLKFAEPPKVVSLKLVNLI